MSLNTATSNPATPTMSHWNLDDVTVVIPVRNAASLLDECLASVQDQGVREVIVVDGMSTDRTLDIARQYQTTILSDEGRGLPNARMLGVTKASTHWVALVDADVILPPGALKRLLTECVEDKYDALQAGLHSTAGPGYWGQALVAHHRSGRSKNWFGVVATMVNRQTLLQYGFDPRFLSGEDIELRWRLQRAGAHIGVSSRTVVEHRFAGDDFAFARDQFLADGRGLARLIRKRRLQAARLIGLPLAACGRGVALSLIRGEPKWIPYYLSYMVGNYVGMLPELYAS